MTETADPLSVASNLIRGLQDLSREQGAVAGILLGIPNFVSRQQAGVDRIRGEFFHSIKRSIESYYILGGYPSVDAFKMTAAVINLMLELEEEDGN